MRVCEGADKAGAGPAADEGEAMGVRLPMTEVEEG